MNFDIRANRVSPSLLRRTVLGAKALLVALILVGISCGPQNAELPQIGELEADRLLYDRGSTALEEGDWRRSRQYFVEIRDNYPQSQYRAAARIGIGETYEQEGTLEAYVRALAEFQDFLSLYPTHPRAAFAQYKLAMVHFHQMRRAERDQSSTMAAVREFENFLSLYPTDQELVPEVRARLREARDRLSAHDFAVGHFYYRFRMFAGAISRFRQIVDEDPGYTQRDEVFFYLGESLAGRGEVTEAIPYFARVLDEFDSSAYTEDAQTRISELEAERDAEQDR
ncbi:MAG: outer membrane protein assembly factor BamD [Acidobacteriota bacterium]|nr:outer membrane protein assembly factor BamD [Acidobacteriota bacterium]